MPSWSLNPEAYTCSQHSDISLTEEVRAQIGDPPLWIPGGGYANLRYPNVVTSTVGKVRAAVQTFRGRKGPKDGPFSVWVDCPGIEGSDKEEDKPHRELCQGDVV